MKPLRSMFRRAFTLPAGVAVAFSMAAVAEGASVYWDGGDGSWATLGKWSTATDATTPNPSAVPGSGDIAYFNISTVNGAETITLDGDKSVAGLVFLNTGTTALTGGGTNRTLTIGGSGIVVNSGAGAVTIGSETSGQLVDIALGAEQFWTNSSTSALVIQNAVNLGSSLLKLNGTGSTSVAGIISGSGGLTVSNGTLTLSAANTYTGDTTVSGGTLAYGINDALNSGNVVVSGGTLSLGTYTDTVGALTLSGGSITGTGTLTASSYTLSNSGTASIAANLAGGGAMTKSGAGTATLSGTNTSLSGSTTISGGVLRIDSASGLSGGNLVFNGGVLGLGAGDFTRALGTVDGQVQFTGSGGFAAYGANRSVNLGGSGAQVTWGSGSFVPTASSLILGASDATHTVTLANPIALGDSVRTVEVANGSAATDAVLSGVVSGSGGLTKSGAGALTLSAVNTYTGATTVSGGTLALTGVGSLATDSALDLSVATAVFSISGHSGGVSVGSLTGVSGSSVVLGINTLTVGGANTSPAAFSGVISGTGGLTKTGTGTLTLGGVNTYSGATTFQGGTVSIGADSGLGAAPASLTPGALVFNGGTLATTSSFTLNANRGIDLQASGGTIEVASATTLTYGGIAAGTGALTKSGAGTLTLSATHTYTGNTIVSGGTLALSGGGSLAGASTVNLSGASAVLDITATTAGATLGALTGVSGSSVVITGKTLTVGSNHASPAAFAGVISGASGALVKTGIGTLTLSGTNTYTGTTTISQGVLRVNDDTALPGGLASTGGTSNLTLSGGVLGLGSGDFTRPLGTGVTDVQFTGSGGFAAYGADRTVNLGGAAAGVTWGSGSFVPSGSDLILGASDATHTVTFANPVDLAGGVRTLQVANGSAGTDAVMSGAISNGTLIKAGDGTLTLSAANSYTGGTEIHHGTLALSGSSNILVDTSAVHIACSMATFDLSAVTTSETIGALSGVAESSLVLGGKNLTIGGNNANPTTFGGVISGSGGSLTKNGSGFLTLSGANTFTGGVSLTAGTLRATTSASALGTGTLTLSGGTLQLANDTGLNFGNATTVSGNTTLSSGRVSNGAAVTHTLGTLAIGASTLSVVPGVNVTSGTAGLTFGATTLSASGATFSPGSGTLLTLGAVSGSGNSFTVTGTGSAAIAGVIGTGTGTLTKSGTGTLTLSGANTFSGGITLSGGILRATTSASALGAGTLTLSGGTLQLANDTGLTYGNATTVSVDSTLTSDLLTSGAGVSHTLGTLSIGAQTLSVAAGANVTSGTAGLTFGATTLSATGTTFSAGVGTSLTLGSVSGTNTAFTVTGSGNTSISGAVATGTGTLTKSGNGTLTLSGTNTFTGGTTLSGGGTLTLDYGTNNTSKLADGAALTLNGGTLTLSGGTHTEAVGSTTLNAGATAITASGSTIALGAITRSSGGTVNFTNTTTNATTTTINTDSILGSWATVGGLNWAVGSTAGAATAITAFTGYATTIPASGNYASSHYELTGNQTGKKSGTMLSLKLIASAANQTFDVGANDALELATGGLLATGANAYSISGTGASLSLAAATTGDLVVHQYNTGGLTIAVPVLTPTTSGTLSLVKTGTEKLTLSGANTYTGATFINQGILSISNAAGLGTTAGGTTVLAGGALELQGGITVGAEALTLSGSGSASNGALRNLSGTNTFGGAITLASAAQITADAGTLTLSGTIGGNFAKTFTGASGTTIASSAAVSGSGGLFKDGAGTLTLSGTNTFTGGITVNGGTLSAGSASALGSGNNLTLNPTGGSGATATLNLNNNSATIGSLSIGGAVTGPVVVSVSTGTGTLTLGGDLSVSGATNFSTGSPTTVSGNLALGATRTFDIGDSNLDNDLTVSALVSGTGFGINKTGQGVLVLSGTNTYTGTTTLGAGTLALNNASGLGSGSLTFGGGLLRYGTGISTDLSSRIVNSTAAIQVNTNGQNVTWASNLAATNTGGLTKEGTGTLTLTGTNAHTGTTTLHAGTLAIGSDAALSGGELVLHGGTLAATGAARTLANHTTLAASSTFDSGSVGLTVSGSISAITVNNETLTLTGTATSGSALTGMLSDAAGAHLSLVKTGTGTWTIAGDNMHGGSTTVSAGILRAAHPSALGMEIASDAVTLGGGTLQLAYDAGSTFGPGSGFGMLLSASSTLEVDRLTSGAGLTHAIGGLTMGGNTLTLNKGSNITSGAAGLTVSTLTTLTGNSTLALGAGTELKLAGSVSGAFNLTKSGAGTLTLQASSGHADTNIQAGALNVNGFTALGTAAGTLTLASGVTLDNTSGAAVTVSNPKSISLGGTLNFTGTSGLNLGTGTVTLGSDTTFNVSAGVLTFNGDVQGAFGITKIGAGTLQLGGLSGTNSYTGNTTINAGTLELTGTSKFKTGTTLTIAAGAQLKVGPTASYEGVTVSLAEGASIQVEAVVVGDVEYAGNATLTPSNANFNGVQTIKAGTTVVAAADYLGTVPNSPTQARIVIENNGVLQASSSFTLNKNKGIQLGTNTGSASGSATLSASSGAQMLLPATLTGDATLVKTGPGNIRLIADNSYRGGTVINQGLIGIFDDASLGLAGTSLTLNGGTIVGASPDSSRTDSGNKTATIASGRSVILGPGTTNGMDAQTGRVLSYTGVIAESSGVANMTFGFPGIRDGKVVLGNANTYSGVTTVRAGIVEAPALADGGVDSSIGNSAEGAANLVLNGGTLKFTGASASTNRLFTLGTSGGGLDTGTGTLTFAGTGDMVASGTGTRTLTLGGSGTGTLATRLVNDSSNNHTSIFKTGSGKWVVTGTNLHSGDTSIEAGTLSIAAGAALGDIGASLIFPSGSTGALETTATLVCGRPFLFNGNGALNVAPGTTGTFAGTFSGSGALTKEGTGTAILSGANTRNGGTNINAGVLKVTNETALGSGAVAIASGATFNIAHSSTTTPYLLSNTLSGAGGLVREYGGAGTSTVALQGTESNTFTGLTEVTGGTLRLDKTSTINAPVLAIGGNATITGGALVFRASEQIPDSATITISGGIFEFSPDPSLGGNRQETIGALVASGGAAVNTNGNIFKTSALTFATGGTGGAVTVNSYDSYTTGAAATPGVLEVSGALAFNAAGSLTIASHATLSNRAVLKGNITVSDSVTAGILNSGTAAVRGTLEIGDTGATTRTITTGTGATLTISAGIANGTGNAAAGLTKDGAGTLVLSGTNTYTGATTVSAGVLEVSGGDAIPDSSEVTVGSGATFRLGANETVGSLLGTGTIQTQSNTLTVGGGNSASTLGLALSGSGGFGKTGTGVLTVSTSQTYTGPTTISGGTLKLNNGVSLASSSIVVGSAGSSGAALDLTANGVNGFTIGSSQTLSGIGTVLAPSGGLVISGTHSPGNSPGIQTIDGNVSYTSTAGFTWELIANTTTGRGTNFDGVNVTKGVVSISSDAIFSVVLNGTGSTVDVYDPEPSTNFWKTNRSWQVFSLTDSSITGTFTKFNVSLDSSGQSYTSLVDSGGHFSFDNTTGTLNWSAVPEPTSALTALLVAAGLMRRRREEGRPET